MKKKSTHSINGKAAVQMEHVHARPIFVLEDGRFAWVLG